MKEFKGCKGEWKHHKPHGYQHSVGGWIQSEKGKVCDVTGLEVGRETAFANANLIAAAPELLEALQISMKVMQEGRNVSYPDLYGAINKARAAIAKAIGEEE